jgi:hypothetical protein
VNSESPNNISLRWEQWRTQNFCSGGGSTNSVDNRGQRERRSGGGSPPSHGFRTIFKWVKPVFLLGCYGCIFHGTGNSAQLCQNFGISGGGGCEHPQTPLDTPLDGREPLPRFRPQACLQHAIPATTSSNHSPSSSCQVKDTCNCWDTVKVKVRYSSP